MSPSWRTDAFKPRCWRRLLRVPWTARRSNQSIIKETNPEQAWEGPAAAEAPTVWSPGANRWFIGRDPDAGKDWGQKKRVSEDEMAGWHRWCNGHELGQTLGGEGQGGLACCSPWGCEEPDTTGQLNNNNVTKGTPCWDGYEPRVLEAWW